MSTIFASELTIDCLNRENLEQAIHLAEEVFPNDRYCLESPGVEYRATLDPEPYLKELAALDIDFQQHWIVQIDRRAVALTGLQHKISDGPQIIWLGWFCVSPSERRKQIGSGLLRWTIEIARTLGYREMRLWTTTISEESNAQVLYERFGFRIFREESEPDGTKRLYRVSSL